MSKFDKNVNKYITEVLGMSPQTTQTPMSPNKTQLPSIPQLLAVASAAMAGDAKAKQLMDQNSDMFDIEKHPDYKNLQTSLSSNQLGGEQLKPLLGWLQQQKQKNIKNTSNQLTPQQGISPGSSTSSVAGGNDLMNKGI